MLPVDARWHPVGAPKPPTCAVAGWAHPSARPSTPGARPRWRLRARPYVPALGRFLSRDPVASGSCNDYDYTCGDPVNGRDLAATTAKVPNGDAECINTIGSAALNAPSCFGYRQYAVSGDTKYLSSPILPGDSPVARRSSPTIESHSERVSGYVALSALVSLRIVSMAMWRAADGPQVSSGPSATYARSGVSRGLKTYGSCTVPFVTGPPRRMR
ncbi:MAG: hypothetical protein LC721_10590 [Actinobacteria bacterium]|nr:hypothetical protein [Actinomycetota bacterium]